MNRTLYSLIFLASTLLHASPIEIGQLEEKEQFLKAFDIHDELLAFKRLGGTTPTNWMVKQDGKPVANLKCTKFNTFHKGAIVAYEFGKILDFNIFPVAVTSKVDREITFDYKDNGVKKSGTIYKKEECALKEWSSNFVNYYWKVDRVNSANSTFSSASGDKRKIIDQLNCKKIKSDGVITLQMITDGGSPGASEIGSKSNSINYIGTTTLNQVARDFSNMMLMDAILGNDDRFPGGNLQFKSTNGKYRVSEDRRTVVFEEARLFSLDNESVMRGGHSYGMADLKKYVTRFDREFIDNLVNLKTELERLDLTKPITGKFDFLNFRIWKGSGHVVKYLLGNIKQVLSHVENSERVCGGDQTYF